MMENTIIVILNLFQDNSLNEKFMLKRVQHDGVL